MYAENENENNEQRPMFIMTLELEDGNTEQIVLYKDSDPDKIANEFCCLHNLKVDYVKYLKEKIQTLLGESNVINEEDEREGKGDEGENEELNKEGEGEKKREDNDEVVDNNEKVMDVQIQCKESEQQDVNMMNDKQNKEEANNDNYSNNNYNYNEFKENNEPIEIEGNNYNNANNINDNVNNNNNNNNNKNVNTKYDLSNKEHFNLNTNNQLINNNNNNTIPSQDNNPHLNHPTQPQLPQSTITKYKEYLTDLQKPHPPVQTHHSTLTTLLPKPNLPSLNTSSPPKTPNNLHHPLKPHIKPKINSTYTLDLNLIDKHQKRKHLINPSNPIYHPITRKCHSKPNTPYTISTTTINVFDRNYNYANHYKQNRIKLSSLYNTALSFNTKHHQSQTNPNALLNTNKIITLVQCVAFSNLFKLLDNDDDGVISTMNMNTKALSHDVYRIIEPIINEIKEEQYKLNENEFINVMFNLYVDINYYDKHLLINTFKHKQHHNICKDIHNNNNNNKHCCSTTYNKCTHVNKTNTFNKASTSSSLRYSFQPSINANASRLARKHDNKQHRLYNEYLSTYYNDINTTNNINKHSRCIKSSEYFTTTNNTNNTNNMKLSYNSIHNYTFNNYLKNLH